MTTAVAEDSDVHHPFRGRSRRWEGINPHCAAVFVCTFGQVAHATEADFTRALADVFTPALPGMVDSTFVRRTDGRFTERMVFDSMQSLQVSLGVVATERQHAASAFKTLITEPLVWMGSLAEVPANVWPFGEPGSSDSDDDDGGCSDARFNVSLTSAEDHRPRSDVASTASSNNADSGLATPTSMTSVAAHAGRSPRAQDFPVTKPPTAAEFFGGLDKASRELFFPSMQYWDLSAGHARGTVERVLLSGSPRDFSTTMLRHVARAMRDRSAPRFRFQHSPYDARPVALARLAPTTLPKIPALAWHNGTDDVNEAREKRHNSQHAADTAPPRRRTLCVSVTLENGTPRRCKCNTAFCAQPEPGSRVILRVPIPGTTAHLLRFATVTHVTSWSRKRAAGADTTFVHRLWESPEDDHHERAMVLPQAAMALRAARAIVARRGGDSMPCVTFDDAFCYHDLSAVCIEVRAVDAAMSREELQATLVIVAQEVHFAVGSPVEWVLPARA